MPPSHALVKAMVRNLMALNGDKTPLGKHWSTRFLKRHKGLKTGRTQPKQLDRLVALDNTIIDGLFNAFATIKDRYSVDWQDVWNMDETGFQMGQLASSRVIFNKDDGPPVVGTTSTTQWVSIIECINASGGSIKPYIIHVGTEPRDSWFLPTEELPDWKWGLSSKGWSNNELGLDWLSTWFIPQTGGATRHRILMLDQHESHVSHQFQLMAVQNNVHLFYLVPHSSGVLQPLDTGPFSPLSASYSKELTKVIPNGFSTITRPQFAKVYMAARPQAFTERNIRAGWKKAGWNPFNPTRIKELPIVRNWERSTPELRPKPRPQGLYQTPNKIPEVEALIQKLCATVSPTTAIGIRKLGHATIIATSESCIAKEELKLLRTTQKDSMKQQRTRRLAKAGQKLTWTRQEVTDARAPKFKVTCSYGRQEGRKSLLLQVISRHLIRKDVNRENRPNSL